MNDTTNNPNGSNSFGGNNSFNNNNPRPNPAPNSNPNSAPSNLPTGNNNQSQNFQTPKFSGMPTSQSASFQPPKPTPPPVVSAPVPMPPKPQVPTPAPAPAPKPPVYNPPAFTPPAPSSVPFGQPRVVKPSGGSHKGLIATIVVILIIVIAGAALWFLRPDMFGMGGVENNNIEDKVANPTPVKNDGSVFPSGVLNANKPATTTAPTKTKTKTAPTYSASDQDTVTAYIKANINKLAHTSGYYITDVTFDGPDRALVSYSNGRVSYSAVVNAYIDSEGKVKVTNFTVLTK